jgi:hypothetical protein
MRHAMANRRRTRPNNGGGSGGGNGGGGYRPSHNKATVFDSNGPDVRIRGTAFQIVEKYLTLAKDAAASGDRVLAENYLQHAEHYQRQVNQWAEENPEPRRFHNDQTTTATDDAPPPETVLVTRTVQPAPVDDDLSLPASILGNIPNTTSEEPARTSGRFVNAG